LNPTGFELLAELLEVLDLKPDVIERAALRPDDRIRGRREIQCDARKSGVGKCPATSSARLGAEHLDVPGLHLGVLLAEEVHVMKGNWNRLGRDFNQLDLHIVWGQRERNGRVAVGGHRNVVLHLPVRRNLRTRNHLETVRLDFLDYLTKDGK